MLKSIAQLIMSVQKSGVTVYLTESGIKEFLKLLQYDSINIQEKVNENV